MDTEKILLELNEKEEQLIDEISELQKKMNDVDPKKMEGQLLDSVKNAAIESIGNALGVSEVLESQIKTDNLRYNSLDADKEYKAYLEFKKDPNNSDKEYTPQHIPKKEFKEIVSLETDTWNRDNVTGKAFEDRKKEMRENNPDGYTSAYTGKHLNHGDNYHYDHANPASVIAKNPVNRKYLSEDIMREELINSKENIVVIEGNINQSKGDTPHERADAWMDARNKKDPSKINEEAFGLDRDKVHETYTKAEVKRKEVLLKHAGEKKINTQAVVDAGKVAVGNGLKSGAKAAVGKLLTISVIELIDEFKLKDGLSIADKIKRAGARIQERSKEIIQTFKEFSITGFISAIVDAILKSLLKTAKNVLKFIKTALFSILKAIRVLFSSNASPTERRREALKILGASVATLIGIALEEVLEKAIVSLFPPLASIAGFISPILAGFTVGIGSVLILQFFQKYQNTMEFRRLRAEQGTKYRELAKTNLTQASVTDIEATRSVQVSFQIFSGTLSIVESCKNSIEESFEEIRKYKDSTKEKFKNISSLQDENDDLLNALI